MSKAAIPPNDSADPPKRSVDPPPLDTRDRKDTDPDGFKNEDTDGVADRALRFMRVVWLFTIGTMWGVVGVYFMFNFKAEAFTETVLGIIVVGIAGSGVGFKFVYNVQS